MPQITSLPGYQATRSELGKSAYEHMFDNLEQNVKYRRAQQQRKSSQAQDMELKMAAGLIPKANLEVTDEGMEFDNAAAKQAYYNQISRMYGHDDRSKKGGTTVASDLIPDGGQFERDVKAATEQNRGTDADYMDAVEHELAKQTVELGQASPKPLSNRDLRNEINDDAQKRALGVYEGIRQNGGLGSLGGAANVAVDMAKKLYEIRQKQAASTTSSNAPASVDAAPPAPAASAPSTKAPPPSATTPAAPAAPPNTRVSESISAKASNQDKIAAAFAEKMSEKASSEFNKETGGIDVSSDVFAKSTMKKESSQIDEIRTSMNNLLGLSALENYNNQLLRTDDNNQTAPLNNTFTKALEQRAADLKRWEEAATTDGTSEKIEKVGTRHLKTTGSKYSGKVSTAAAAGASLNLVNAQGGTGVGGSGGNSTSGGASTTPGKLFATNANGATTQLSVDPASQKLTANVSGLAFMTSGAGNFKNDAELAAHFKQKVDSRNAAPLKPGKYDVKQAGNQIRITTPENKIIVLQKNDQLKKNGAAVPGILHGWEASANAGVDAEELQYFLGINTNAQGQ